MNHSNHSYKDCPELAPARTGWIDPSPDQMDGARQLVGAMPSPDQFVISYLGAVLESIAAGDFGSDSIRRAIAMHRAWKEKAS